ncbi:MAG: hypothetical protein KGH75_00900 [Rhodospirillales bacterium]|nr:hypothetical protein [Rhodospirillales bacterium]
MMDPWDDRPRPAALDLRASGRPPHWAWLVAGSVLTAGGIYLFLWAAILLGWALRP